MTTDALQLPTTHSAQRRGERLFPGRSSRLYWHLTSLRKNLQAVIDLHVRSAGFHRLLDFGCGTGLSAIVAAERSIDIVGTDIARLPESPLTQHVQVDSSHLAFALNARALAAVAVALRAGHTH